MAEEPELDDAAEAPVPRGASGISSGLASDLLAAAAAPAAAIPVDEIELAKQRAHEIALALFHPRPPTAIAPLQTLASAAAESQYPKRKFDDAALPRGASDPLAAAAAPAAAISGDGIELAKQRAHEIVSRIFITAEAKRPRVEKGAGGAEETKAQAAISGDEIELAKRRAYEIVSRIFSTVEAKRPRIENGAGGAEETKGFGSTVPDHCVSCEEGH